MARPGYEDSVIGEEIAEPKAGTCIVYQYWGE